MEHQFTDQNFETEVLKSELPVLVDFFAVWCGPCQMMAPLIEELSSELEGKVKVGKMNVDENEQTAQKYSIMSIPTLILFKKGEVFKTLTGLRTKEDILAEILEK
jgi:thioredoxin 1